MTVATAVGEASLSRSRTVRGRPSRFRDLILLSAIALIWWPVAANAQWGYPFPPYPAYHPVAPDSSIRLDVEPQDAEVYVDGYYAGVVDEFDGVFQRLRVTPGQHEIVIYRDGYRSIRQQVFANPNGSRKISRKMERLAADEPNDPKPVPAKPPPAPPEPPGTQPFPPRGQPERPAGVPTPPPPRGSGPTRPALAGTMGSVIIRVQPQDAEIVIDGERWTLGADDERLVVQLPSGRHHLDVRKPGYRSVTLDVEVGQGETVPVNVSLARE